MKLFNAFLMAVRISYEMFIIVFLTSLLENIVEVNCPNNTHYVF